MAQTNQAPLPELQPGTAGRILLVDDQPELRRLFRRNLSKAGYVVVEASNGRIAVELAQQLRFDVVISDISMPDMDGLELLNTLTSLDADLPVVLTSGSIESHSSQEVRCLGAYAYLLKPVAFEAMRDVASRAVALRRERAATREQFEPYESVERLRVPDPTDATRHR